MIKRIAFAIVSLAILSGTFANSDEAFAKQTPHNQKVAEHKYNHNLGSSKAWKHANHKERIHASEAYLGLFGSWDNGCKADLRHAYQGTYHHHKFIQPHLPVTIYSVKGPDIMLAEFSKGVCDLYI